MGYGFWQGAEKVTGQAAQVGMGLLQRQDQLNQQSEQRAMQKDYLDIAKGDAQQRQRKAELEIEQQQRDMRMVNVREKLAQIGLSIPAQQDVIINKYKHLTEEIDGELYIPQKAGLESLTEALKDPGTQLQLSRITLEGIKAKIGEMSNPESAKGMKPEEHSAMMQQLYAAKEELVNQIRQVELSQLQMQSTEGKREGDRAKLVSLRGEGSPEVQRFDAKDEGGEKDEFNRNLSRLIKLEEEGKQGSREYKFIASRLAKMSETAPGISFSYNPADGAFAFTQGGAAAPLITRLPGKDILKEHEQANWYESNISMLDEMITSLQEKPTRGGVAGAVIGAVQKGTGMVSDIAPKQITDTMRGVISALPGLTQDKKDALADTYFDPALPLNELRQNAVAIALAKFWITSGKDGMRAFESAFKLARKETKTTGAFSSQEAIAKLKEISRQFESALSDQEARLTGQQPQGAVRDGEYRNPDTGETIVIRNGQRE